MNKKEKILDLLNEVNSIKGDFNKFDKAYERAQMLVSKLFPVGSDYSRLISNIKYGYGLDRVTQSEIEKAKIIDAQNKFKNLVLVMLEELNLPKTKSNELIKQSVFIVHGHNEEMKQSTARFIERIGLEPIILHEQPDKGRTIIQKFFDNSDVHFAIVLLSADDFAFEKNKDKTSGKFRARQNVILELGFFLGKIGQENVRVLHEQSDKFEFPSDYNGVLYTPYDTNGNWQISIAKEMKATGFNIDFNKLLT